MNNCFRYKLLSLFVMMFSAAGAQSPTELQLRYRDMALDYNHDIKSARENIEASMDIVGAARADLKPKLGAGASYQSVGHPMELNIHLEALGSPVSLQGQNDQYNAFLSLSQPVYQGGRLLAILKRAAGQRAVAHYQSHKLTRVVSQQSAGTLLYRRAMGAVAAVALEHKASIEVFVWE